MSVIAETSSNKSGSQLPPEFSLTENAAKKIAELAKVEKAGAFFRINISGGGCSGFQYNFSFDTEIKEEDHKFEKNGVFAVIDDMSLAFVKGSELDYFETLGSAGFEIKNPNATANCGCGKSFSV